MEILEHGNTYQEKKCQNCEALIGFAERDIEHKTMRDAYNESIHTTVTEFVYCPECGCRLVLSLSIDGTKREVRGDS